jgi:hypothetical protein
MAIGEIEYFASRKWRKTILFSAVGFFCIGIYFLIQRIMANIIFWSLPIFFMNSGPRCNCYLNFARVGGFHLQALNNAADGSLRRARRVKIKKIDWPLSFYLRGVFILLLKFV